MKTFNHKALAGLFVLAALTASNYSIAAPPYFQGFEDPGFAADTDPGDFHGPIIRVTSGTNGVTSKTGVAHAEVNGGGVFTRFGGYSSSFGDGFTTSVDVFLDTTAWADGTGFDFSSAASKQDGDHLRDFIWHVGVDGTDLLVNGSNNTDFSFNLFKLKNENAGPTTVSTSGWYTFENVFRDNGSDELAVDFNLRDSSGSLVSTFTRSTAADLISSVVGGNRYGWFTYNTITNLAIDNVSVVPEPGTIALLSTSLLGLLAAGRRRFKK